MKKMLRTKIIRFRNFYNFTVDYFFIGVISFLLLNKNDFIKIKNSIFSPKCKRCGKNVKEQNCLFQEDTQIYFEPFFDETHSFRFNRKTRYQKRKIQFCKKSMRDTKKILGNKIIGLYLKICY